MLFHIGFLIIVMSAVLPVSDGQFVPVSVFLDHHYPVALKLWLVLWPAISACMHIFLTLSFRVCLPMGTPLNHGLLQNLLKGTNIENVLLSKIDTGHFSPASGQGQLLLCT